MDVSEIGQSDSKIGEVFMNNSWYIDRNPRSLCSPTVSFSCSFFILFSSLPHLDNTIVGCAGRCAFFV